MKKDEEVWMHCTNSAIRRAARQLGQLYDDMISQSGLKGTQFSLLSQIARSEEPTLKILAEALVMDLSALGHTLKPLIRDGYVELVADAADRRAKRVRLTESGRTKQQEATVLWRKAQDRFDEIYGERQSREIREALAVIASRDFAARFKAPDMKP